MLRRICCCCCCKPSAARPAAQRESSDEGDSTSEEEFWEHYDHRDYDSYIFPPGKLFGACCAGEDTDDTEDEGSFPRRRQRDQSNCWDIADGKGVQVRGPNYLNNRKKVESRSPMLQLLAVDLFAGSDVQHYGSSRRFRLRGGDDFLLLLNFRLPQLQLITVWAVPEDADWTGSHEGHLLRRYLHEMDDQDRNKRLKLIPRVLEGSFFLKQAIGSKPAVIGNSCSIAYFQEQDYFEASVDMTSSSTGKSLASLLNAGNCVVELFFVLEGLQPDELPERLLGGLTLCYVNAGELAPQ